MDSDVVGGYYTHSPAHAYYANTDSHDSQYDGWFGLGGCWFDGWSTAGSGGIAGKGGAITCANPDNVHAYNGNRITEDDYDYTNTPCYDYDENGEITSEVAKLETFVINGQTKQIIPAKIFIQDGTRRAVYDNLFYMSDERKEKYHVNLPDAQLKIKNQSALNTVKCVEILPELTGLLHSHQGIGSGAGYIELDNGTYN